MALYKSMSSHQSRRTGILFTTSLVFTAILLIFFTQSHTDLTKPIFRMIKTCELSDSTSHKTPNNTTYRDLIPTSLESATSKYAYVTLLAPDRSVDYGKDINDDVYFSAIRLLAYQLLHAKETRSEGIPFVVMTVPGVREAKKERLRKDGAIVHEIEHLVLPEWLADSASPAFSRFALMFDKLRAWELTQFERILFMDTDVVLTAPMHGIFESEASKLQKTVPAEIGARDGSEAVINGHKINPDDFDDQPIPPEHYVFATTHELNFEHNFPPTYEGGDYAVGDSYFNAGLFLAKPSLDMFDYLLKMLEIPNFFPTDMMEQNFLNNIHSWSHHMPWAEIDPMWHIHWPTKEDVDAGVRSFHGKWWEPHHAELLPFFQSFKFKMDGFFEAYDQFVLEE